MINREICVDCPKRTEGKLGTLRNACAKLALGRDYVAPDCAVGGPFVEERTIIEGTIEGANYTAVKEKMGCGNEGPIDTTTSRYSEGVLASMRRGDEQIFPPQPTE